jgi:glycine/D-amino acid oxidase-like deaminating enzyme
VTVVVVGGGALGLMHAIEARRRGHDVVHLEREPGPRGASVRNFGLIWLSGRAGGLELDLARRSRARWEELALDAPGTSTRSRSRSMSTNARTSICSPRPNGY